MAIASLGRCATVKKYAAAILTLSASLSCSTQVVPVTPAAAERSVASVDYPANTDPSGCFVEQVTSAEFDEFHVQGVSRDGRYLAYGWRRGVDEEGNPVRGAYIMDLQTGKKRALSEPINNSGHFSPDGEYLVVAADVPQGKTDIIELHLASGKTRTIAQHDAWEWLPSYSPDGRFIVFNSTRNDGQADVYVYERATGSLERITDYPGYDAHAQFSPDGQRILFHRMNGERDDGGYDFSLMIHDRATEVQSVLLDGPFEESYGAFAPDGQHIVFSADFEQAPEKHNLYIWSPDAPSYTLLTKGDWTDRYAYWTPDGEYIYFNSDRTGVESVHRLPMRGNQCLRAD